MIEKFGDWFHENHTPISWFVIGWLTMAFVEQFSKGHYESSIIDAILIWVNYSLWKRNTQ